MDDAIYVNFHAHSSLSDGAVAPAVLAEYLADADVRYAALTDHDTIDGLARFRDALAARGIPSLPGLELTTRLDGRLAHILAYGFDPDHPELTSTLAALRGARIPEHSITGSLRAARVRRDAPTSSDETDVSDDGALESAAAIALIHRAGGRAFLAHPLVLEPDPERLERLVGRLKEMGLDGLEAVYADHSRAEQDQVRALAHRHDLLLSAGTDYHGINGLGSQFLGISMPRDDWIAFRDAVLTGPWLADEGEELEHSRDHVAVAAPSESARPGRRSFALRVVLPAAATLGLFLAALWLIILPSFEQTLIDRKRELIRELTNSAWSVLAAYQEDEAAGLLTRAEAQAAAAAVVGELRYGPDNLDYFWIQDTEPTMVMHPYRTDLEGSDLSAFTDPRGVPIFVEFAELVEAQDDGYVDYVWQWFDDPERLEPKESYIKGFAPWGWVIGTGLYTDDVQAEIDGLERDLILAAVGVSAVTAVLLLVVLQQSLRIERRREQGVERLRHSSARYHALAEATTEGTLLVIGGRCRYANPTMLAMLGYSARQLEFLELVDVLPRSDANTVLWRALDGDESGEPALGEPTDGVISTAAGTDLECVLTLNPVVFSGQSGFVLLARDVTALASAAEEPIASAAPAGVFRARPSRRGVFVELTAVAQAIVAVGGPGDGEQRALADLFDDPADFGRFMSRLEQDGEITDYRLERGTPTGQQSLLLSAAMVRDPEGEPASIDGLLVDVTTVRGEAADRDLLLERLGASPFALQRPVRQLARPAVTVELSADLGEVARRMTEAPATAALVVGDDGATIGIVTDVDLRARAVAEGLGPDEPVHAIMTAPVVHIASDAPVTEALLRMETYGVRHLVVADPEGGVARTVERKTITSEPDFAPLAALRDVQLAADASAVARAVERATPMAQGLLESSVRPRLATGLLTSVFDAATVRLIELAIDELGPPPVPFAFVAMGSQGRGEVTLRSDQDSAIVYQSAVRPGLEIAPGTDEVQSYFLALGARVADGLDAAGYPRCRGGVMASEPAWCRSLAGWIEAVDGWVRRARPQDVADLSVFLDFRSVHGDAELTTQLRRHVQSTLPGQAAVLYQLVRNALAFKPPMRLPGNIYLGGGVEHGQISLKDALQSLVAFARVYAARHHISRTHTLARIEELADQGVLSDASRTDIDDAYDTLMGMRLAAQAEDARAGRPPSSSIELATLSHSRQERMRQAFAQIAELQKRADADFPEASG